MFKILMVLFLSHFALVACPFDEAKVEVTIVAHKSITKAIKNEDYKGAIEEIKKQKELYTYFEKSTDIALYSELLNATKEKNSKKVKKLLDLSLALEIKELLMQVDGSFDKYQKARLLLIKTKKHLKALTKKREPMKYMKKILKSIGNPGMMGVGKRDPDKKVFKEYKSKLLRYLDNNFK
jgi:hypothetical protein